MILSSSSVDSTNVMDEVSFALEEREIVIPVLHRECKIPFRLRRVQYVDFRGEYATGVRELLKVMGVEEKAESARAAGETRLRPDRNLRPLKRNAVGENPWWRQAELRRCEQSLCTSSQADRVVSPHGGSCGGSSHILVLAFPRYDRQAARGDAIRVSIEYCADGCVEMGMAGQCSSPYGLPRGGNFSAKQEAFIKGMTRHHRSPVFFPSIVDFARLRSL